jgi:hypothetical protein
MSNGQAAWIDTADWTRIVEDGFLNTSGLHAAADRFASNNSTEVWTAFKADFAKEIESSTILTDIEKSQILTNYPEIPSWVQGRHNAQ